MSINDQVGEFFQLFHCRHALQNLSSAPIENIKPRLCEENRHAFIWTKKKEKKRHAYMIDKYIMLVKGQIRRKLEFFLKIQWSLNLILSC